MLFSCKRSGGSIDKGGKRCDPYEAIAYAPKALDAFANQDAIGLTLTGSLDSYMKQAVVNYDKNYNIESFGYMYEKMGMSKVNISANVKGLDNTFNNSVGSASGSAIFTADFRTENVKNADPSQVINNLKKNIKGNAYLANGTLYMDHNQEFADAVNEMGKVVYNSKLEDSADKKYYYEIPGANNFIFASYMRRYITGNTTILQYLNLLPQVLGDRLTAKRYSNTNYGLFLEADFFEIASLFGANTPHSDSKEKSKIGIVYNTATGIEAIQLNLRVAYHNTFEDVYGSYVPLQYKDEIYMQGTYNIDLTLKATYGKNVKVKTLTDTSAYTISLGGSGGESKPEPDPDPEPDYLDEVSYDTFYAYAEQAYKNSARVNYSHMNMDMRWNFPDDNDSFIYSCPFPFDAELAREGIGGREMTNLMISLYTGDEIITPELVFYLNQTFEKDSSAGIYYYVGSNNRLRLQVEYFDHDCSFSLEWNKYGYFTYADYHLSNGDIYESYELYIYYYA